MRREDLIVPYSEPAKTGKEGQDVQSTLSSTMPMAAIFTRNKIIAWTAVIFAIQGWLSETPAQKAESSQPAYFSVGMSLLAVAVTYMSLFMPPPSGVSPGAPVATPA